MAALAYQESHWNPYAKSPTGVRGLMMLTLPTARSVGVSDRLDPDQSIRGGVEYLRRMMERVPDSISEHEKIWFALASYNVGYGHMMDARRLTKMQGADPDSWADVKDRLPQLQQKKYFTQTRYGYARGDEARNYVENIRRYYQSIIGHLEQRQLTAGDDSIEDLAVIELDEESLGDDISTDDIDEDAVKLESESLESSESSALPSDENKK
ncbi:transglycosylase SLT domain protein [Vibrio mimicus]|nr:transglycosylase SLT domain protein [Vibrio mimicus]